MANSVFMVKLVMDWGSCYMLRFIINLFLMMESTLTILQLFIRDIHFPDHQLFQASVWKYQFTNQLTLELVLSLTIALLAFLKMILKHYPIEKKEIVLLNIVYP